VLGLGPWVSRLPPPKTPVGLFGMKTAKWARHDAGWPSFSDSRSGVGNCLINYRRRTCPRRADSPERPDRPTGGDPSPPTQAAPLASSAPSGTAMLARSRPPATTWPVVVAGSAGQAAGRGSIAALLVARWLLGVVMREPGPAQRSAGRAVGFAWKIGALRMVWAIIGSQIFQVSHIFHDFFR
jgi:hypothetical protein